MTAPTVPSAPAVTRREPGGTTRVLGALAVAIGGAALVALCYVVGVLDRAGRRADERAMRAAMALASGYRDELRTVLDVAAPAAVLLIGVLVLRAWRPRRNRAVTVAVIVLGSQALTQVLKIVLPSPSGWNSLPSGHVTVAVTTLVALALLAPRLRRPLLALAVPVVALVGFATMTVGWHRPADVVAAVGVVALVSGLAYACRAPADALLPRPIRPRSG